MFCSRGNKLTEQHESPKCCKREETTDLAGAGVKAVRAGRGCGAGQGAAAVPPARAAARAAAGPEALPGQQSQQHYTPCEWIVHSL